MNRQTKRQMAKSGTDSPVARTDRRPPAQSREAGTHIAVGVLLRGAGRDAQGRVADTRPEVINSTMVVLIAVIFMGASIFALDWASAHFVLFLFG